YGIPASFAFQPNPIPHRPLTQEQDLDYRAQSAIHGDQPETIVTFLERFGYRIRYYRFYFLPTLYLALAAFLVSIRKLRNGLVVLAVLVFMLGSNLYPYFYAHYVGAASCLFVLMSVAGLSNLNSWAPRWCIGTLLLMICTVQFLFWYGIRLSGQEDLFPVLAY